MLGIWWLTEAQVIQQTKGKIFLYAAIPVALDMLIMISLYFILILEIELNGARQVRKNEPDAILVFIEPPSWQELESRLLNRGTESSESLERRLARAKEELLAASEFDFVLVNTQVDQVVAELVSLALGNSR